MATPVGRSPAGPSGSGSGSSGSRRPNPTLDDFLPPVLQQDSSGWQAAGRRRAGDAGRHRDDDARRRETLFHRSAATPGTPAVQSAARTQASPDVYPVGADVMARLLAVEEQNHRQAAALQQQQEENRQQAAALQQQDAELRLLRAGGRSPSPAAGAADRDRRIADLEAALAAQHQDLQLLRAAHVQPAAAEQSVASKPGLRLRLQPEFLSMALVPTSTADDVSRMVRFMFEAFGTIADGDAFQQLLLWVFKLPASDASSVPAVATDAVAAFCVAHHLPLTPSGVTLTQGADCFGSGREASHRRLVFTALLSAVSKRGVLKDIDRELLLSFRPRLTALRLSDSDLALPSFVSLLAKVLHFVNHGPSSVLASVVAALFTCAPHEPTAAVNHQVRCLETDLASKLSLFAELARYPCLLPALLSAAVVPSAPGAAGTALQRIVADVLDLAADPSTAPADLVRFVAESTQNTGMVGSQVVPWTAAAESPFLRLLAPRPAVLSASPAAGAVPSGATPAPSKSAPSKRPPRAAAKVPPPDGQHPPCPLGAACPTAGDLYNFCTGFHSSADWEAIRARRAKQGLTCLTSKSRKALLQQIAAQGGPPGSGGGGGQPRASPSAAAAAAPAQLMVPPSQPVQPPPPTPGPSPLPASGGLGAASVDHVAALAQFLHGYASGLGAPAPSGGGLPSASVASPPSFAMLPAAAVPPHLAAASPLVATARSPGAVWGGSAAKRLVCADSGTKYPYAPNTAGAPTQDVVPETCVTSNGTLSSTRRAFSATFHVQGADKGPFYEVTVDGVREQPGLYLPVGSSSVPVMLLDPVASIAGCGGELYIGPQYATGVRGEKPGVVGWVRLPVRGDPADPLAPDVVLSKKIFADFSTGVFAVPTCDLPAGAVPIPVSLGARPAPLSASSLALTASGRSFGELLRVCGVWHSAAAPAVRAYAAMSALQQAAFRACHGGRDAAADLRHGLSLFASCLDDLSSVVLRELGAGVTSCSAVSVPAPAAAGAAVSAPSSLVALLGLVQSALAPSSGAVLSADGLAVPSAAPPASSSSSSSLLSPQ